MKKEIKEIDKARGIYRITSLNSRWYAKPEENKSTGLPEYGFYPSSTWISGYYPKGQQFIRWKAEKGWDESERIKKEAGDRGTVVHQATELLEKTGELPITTPFVTTDNVVVELGQDEIEGILSFKRWHDETKPKLLANEITVFGEDYAGTLDRIYEIEDQVWIVDIKTSQDIWEEHILQVSSYSHAQINFSELGISEEKWSARKLAILQLGYRRNKSGWKFTEIPDKYGLFRNVRQIWENENPEAKPKVIEYPMIIKINEKEAQNARHQATGKILKA